MVLWESATCPGFPILKAFRPGALAYGWSLATWRKIGYLYLRNGKWEGKQLLPDAWIGKIKHATIDVHVPQEPGLWYSNLFWALPDKHVYVANGLYGQNIMVFPNLDVVAVTTAALFSH